MRLVAASCVVSLALSLPRPFPRLRRPRCAPLTLEATEGAADAMSDAALRDLVARAWGGSTNRSVLPAWSGQNLWLWAQWRGTVLSHCLERALLTAAGGAVVLWSAKGGVRGGLPDPSHPVVARLAAVDAMWGHHLTLTTFVATFFLSHGYAFWRQTVWKSNLQPDFNVSVCDGFDATCSDLRRELDESDRFVQKPAESTSI